MTKRCKTCGLEKPVTEFYKGSKGQRYRTSCKPCINKEAAARTRRPEYRERMRQKHAALSPEERQAHKDRIRSYHRKSKYGITVEQWQQMQKMQDGLCGICGFREATHVDHDHETDEIRMLLCNQCNQMLGFAQEQPGVLRAAADYLESFFAHRSGDV